MTGRKLSSSSLVGDAGNTQRRVGRDSAAALTSAPEKVCRHYREEPKGFGYNERSWSVNSKNLQVTVRYGFTRLRILPKSMINGKRSGAYLRTHGSKDRHFYWFFWWDCDLNLSFSGRDLKPELNLDLKDFLTFKTCEYLVILSFTSKTSHWGLFLIVLVRMIKNPPASYCVTFLKMIWHLWEYYIFKNNFQNLDLWPKTNFYAKVCFCHVMQRCPGVKGLWVSTGLYLRHFYISFFSFLHVVSDRNSTPQCPGGSPVGQFFCQKQM